MSGRWRYSIVALLSAVTASGCSGGSGGSAGDQALPEAAATLTRSAEAMEGLSTARLVLDIEGTIGISGIRAATAQVTREGEATGSVSSSRDEVSEPFEFEFVVADGNLYVRQPPAGFQVVPPALASDSYDPSVLLDPDKGIPALLRSGTDAVTEAREQLDRVDSYRVKATFAGAALALIPGLDEEASGLIWVSVDDSRVMQVRFTVPDGVATMRLSDFDEPADITAPE